jgi:hypothetical protein
MKGKGTTASSWGLDRDGCHGAGIRQSRIPACIRAVQSSNDSKALERLKVAT